MSNFISSSMALPIAGRYVSEHSYTFYFTRCHCSVSSCRSAELKYFSAGRLHRWNSCTTSGIHGIVAFHSMFARYRGSTPIFPQTLFGAFPTFHGPLSRQSQRFQSRALLYLLPYFYHLPPLYSSSIGLGMM